MPGTVVLLKTEPQLTVPFEIDKRGFTVNWMMCVVELVRPDVPFPLGSFQGS